MSFINGRVIREETPAQKAKSMQCFRILRIYILQLSTSVPVMQTLTMCFSRDDATAVWLTILKHLAPPTHMLPWRYLVSSTRSAPRINVLLCHHRGYDPCNAAERVRSVKSGTRSISGRNVLAAARCLDAPETKIKIKKKICQGSSQALTPDSAL